jgi:hypothetical protein
MLLHLRGSEGGGEEEEVVGGGHVDALHLVQHVTLMSTWLLIPVWQIWESSLNLRLGVMSATPCGPILRPQSKLQCFLLISFR